MTFDLIGNRTMHDLLREMAGIRGDHPLFVFVAKDESATTISYADFLAMVEEKAAGLQRLGIGHGDKVVVHLPNCPEFAISWFALASLGAVMVPSNVNNTAYEMEHVVGYSDSVAVITEPTYLPMFRQVISGIPAVGHLILARSAQAEEGCLLYEDIHGDRADFAPQAVDSEDVQEMLFTSGTTGRPKGVLLTHANALRAGERSSRMLLLDRTERFLSSLPLFHVNAQAVTLMSTLTVGGTCIFLEEFRATKFWRQVQQYEATATSLVAMQARTLLAQPELPTDSEHRIRRVFYAINVSTTEKEEFERRFAVELVNGYGLTEAMTLVSISSVFGEKRWPSIGRPIFDRIVRLIDSEGQDVPIGSPGEIIVQGVQGRTLMKGYYKDPEATAQAIRDGWLYTGDNAVADEQGFLYFFDRKKDVIKRAGENISATEVEFVLLEHEGVVEAAVIGVPDSIRDEAVKAFIVTEPSTQVTVEDITQFCAQRLAGFKVPTEIVVLDALPKTSIGKIEKKKLRDL